MYVKITVLKHDGDVWRTFVNPTTWTVDDKGVLIISDRTQGTVSVVRTTLPFYVESDS